MALAARLYTFILYAMAFIAGAMLVWLMVSIVVSVLMRNLGIQPFAWLFTSAEYGLLYMTMLGAPWLVREKGHVHIELVTAALPPAIRRIVSRLVALARVHDASARIGAGRLKFRQRWAVLSAANIYGAIGEEVARLGEAAWDHRVHTGTAQKLGHVASALKESVAGSYEPEEEPKWTRGQLMVMARMAGPVPGVPNTPLRDEGVRRKED